MALEVSFALKKNGGQAVVFTRDDVGAPFRYRHETYYKVNKPDESTRLMAQQMYLASGAPTATIFATREGLVGGTTANGHIITQRDRFVALPSRRALARKDSYDFQVRVTYNGRSVTAPVWDVGPWNTRDDYWSPSSVREMWRDLPQFEPEAQAAYFRGYNNGKDQYGRSVPNPAGIDLADGTFWDDLRMINNGWVTVEYLWLSNNVDKDEQAKRDMVAFAPQVGFYNANYTSFGKDENWSSDWELRWMYFQCNRYGLFYYSPWIAVATNKRDPSYRLVTYQVCGGDWVGYWIPL
jgi:hypothetical protein